MFPGKFQIWAFLGLEGNGHGDAWSVICAVIGSKYCKALTCDSEFILDDVGFIFGRVLQLQSLNLRFSPEPCCSELKKNSMNKDKADDFWSMSSAYSHDSPRLAISDLQETCSQKEKKHLLLMWKVWYFVLCCSSVWFNKQIDWVCWYTPVILDDLRLRQEYHNLKPSVCNWVTLWDPA